MARKLRYRTYITRLWLATMIAPPLVFFLFSLFAGAGIDGEPDDPLLLAVYLFIAIIFTVPTVLFIIVASLIIPHVSKRPLMLKRVTIITLVLGVIATFLLVSGTGAYSGEQLIWGIFLAMIYALAVIGFGWRFRL